MILHLVILFCLFTSFKLPILTDSLGITAWKIMSSVNINSLFISNLNTFYLFFLLGRTYFVHNLSEQMFILSLLGMMLAWGFSFITFIDLRKFPSIPCIFFSFYHEWVLNFVKYFPCFYWYEGMVFLIHSTNVMKCIDWFLNVEPPFLVWTPTGYHVFPFYILLHLFAEDFYSYGHEKY